MAIILWVSYGYPMGILWYSLVIGRLKSRERKEEELRMKNEELRIKNYE